MNILQDAIRGPYAFLLVLQILIVAGLLLALLWLILQRAREGMEKVTQASVASQPAPAVEAVTATATVEPSTSVATPTAVESTPAAKEVSNPAAATPSTFEAAAVSSSAVPQPETTETAASATVSEAPPSAEPVAASASSASIENPPGASPPASDEVSQLKDKIKYLESRLLEYEIVQEEISSLSQLRVENERLKEELVKYQGGSTQSSATAAPPAGQVVSVDVAAPTSEDPAQAQINTILDKIDKISAKG